MNCNDAAFLQLDPWLREDLTRRTFLKRAAGGMGMFALGSLLADETARPFTTEGAKAKRIIFLHQSGAPSHVDLFDYKPKLAEMRGQDLPESVRKGQRLTGMTAGYNHYPLLSSPFKFAQHGAGGAWLSQLWPHLSQKADEICFIKT